MSLARNEPTPRYVVRPDPGAVAALSSDELAIEQRKAIDAFLDLVPPTERERARDLLLFRNSVPVGADDPEMAKHLSRIASIRAEQVRRLRSQQDCIGQGQ
jgi:hypothetical protein